MKENGRTTHRLPDPKIVQVAGVVVAMWIGSERQEARIEGLRGMNISRAADTSAHAGPDLYPRVAGNVCMCAREPGQAANHSSTSAFQ